LTRFFTRPKPELLPGKSDRLTFWPLVAATFFMVSGGTYGTEDIVRGAGYGGAILVLLLTPVLWSLPTALMIGELGSALPKEGGYYAWVRRAFGNFLGFQEAWLSLAASIFDMAIYPTLFVLYLTRLLPWFGVRQRGVLVGAVVVTVCAVLNIAGVRIVGSTSLWLFLLLSTPFVAIVVLAPFHHRALAETVAPPVAGIGVIGGVLVAMWNYMGWDNASTIAEEVERPQRTYPRAMLVTLAIIALSYIVPLAAVWWTHLPAGSFAPGAWADIAGLLGGSWLRVFTVAAAMMSAFGMFNALVLSYSRVPLAMAEDGMLPRVFARVHPRTSAPWVSIVALATAWALCLGLGFERLVTLDIMLYGASLALEFAALVALRITTPGLPRPFHLPGGLPGAVALGVCPMALLGFSLVHSSHEHILGMNALLFGALIVGSGFVLYLFTGRKEVSEVSEVSDVSEVTEA
jgi:amino acid transporter